MDLGLAAVHRIANLWQVDDDRVTWSDDGFDWWPGSFRVSVLSQKSSVDELGETWRLIVRTAFLKELPVEDDKKRSLIALMSAFAPTYSWVYTPFQIAEKYGADVDRTLRFQSTAYLRADTMGWLPELFGRLAILQAIDAQRQAEVSAPMLGAVPDVSLPSESAATDHLDEMLNVAELCYLPMGQNASRWTGSGEFAQVAERFGKSDLCFGTGGQDGLTLETPFGSSSALVRLRADQRHPALGAGLLATLELPFWEDQAAATDTCMWLNFFESVLWSDAPQLGGWHVRETGKGSFGIASASFFPNALYKDGLATNIALWQLGRARWAKQQLWPDLVDLTMMEVLTKRLTNLAE
jgi:hypothetical protein